ITGTGQIDVTGLQAGHATITATVPPAFGSVSTLIDVNVYEPANLVLNPISLTVPTGFNATISASFNPALTAPDGATLSIGGNGSITFPDHISIDAAKSSTFTIKGVTPGLVLLTATLGSNHGHTSTFISVLVTEPPTTPSITQISPANGPAAGGTNVTLNGTNLRADCTIRFGGVAATNVAYVSATSMTATTPGHAAGTTDVSLVCGADTFNLTNAFTYLAASATLSGVSPSFGTTAGGTVVKITGTNFTNGCWPFFDALAAHNAYLTAPTEIIAATPAHPSAATVPLMLRCGGAPDVSLADAFTYSIAESSPVITTVDPLVGSAGKSVTISGARFRFDDVVTFDSTPAVILSTSPGTHVVRIPDLPLGKTSISVTDTAGRTSTTGPIFTIVEPQPPQITNVSPTTTRAGNEVTIDGSGFRPGYTFTIGDQSATFVSMTYTHAVVRVPQLAAGTYGVNALNAASKIAAVGPQVTVLAPGLAITRLNPSCVTTEGGTRITIYGIGFADGAVVTFDGVVANATVAGAQTITLLLPPLPAGMPRIVITNPGGDSASLSNGLNVVSPFDPNGCAPRGRPARH
ncbi:MAG: IPT/TIG domain-containing protein, partial [Thermoanaerobaculia bacterium]